MRFFAILLSLGLHGVMASLSLLPHQDGAEKEDSFAVTVTWEASRSPLEEQRTGALQKGKISPVSVITVLVKAGNTGTQEVSHIKNSGPRTLRKSKADLHELKISKFQNHGPWGKVTPSLVGKVTQKGREGSSISKKSYQPLPKYPWICRKRGQEGQVHLCVQTNAEGHVTKAKIHKSSGYSALDHAALDAVKTWVFVEGTHQKHLTLAFRLKE